MHFWGYFVNSGNYAARSKRVGSRKQNPGGMGSRRGRPGSGVEDPTHLFFRHRGGFVSNLHEEIIAADEALGASESEVT